MRFLKNLFCGGVIGVAAILPGVSGGVLATVLGIYEPIISAISGFFKDAKKNFFYLLPFAVGGAAGFFIAGKLVFSLMSAYENQALFVFSGLVLGGMPALIATANSKGFKKRYLLAAFIAFFASFTLSELAQIPIRNEFLRYFAGGGVYAFGSIVPGVSASFILINMGIYKDIITSLTEPRIIIPFAVGAVLFAVLIIRAAAWLFKRFHGYAYYASIGLLTASIAAAFPAFDSPFTEIPLFSAALIIGFFFLGK